MEKETQREIERDGKIYRSEFLFHNMANIFLQIYSCAELSSKIADCHKLFV